MKITIKNQTIDLSDEDLKKHGLQRIEKKKEFEVGCEYYFIDSDSEVCTSLWDEKEIDEKIQIGNAFHTEEEAENHLAWLKARAKIVRRIKELNEGWVPYWNMLSYNIYYDHQRKCLKFFPNYYHQNQPQEMYLKSEELAQQLIKELEKELKIYLGVK